MASAAPVGSADAIDGVIERMQTIDSRLPAEDGVAEFNRMYLRVTREVGTAVKGTMFQNEEFLAHLDVVFANLFFAAYDADLTGAEVPHAWAPLFSAREKPHTRAIQFALAGMNAHINHDLGLAVVQCCQQMALEPHDDSPEHHDYRETNSILDSLMPSIKSWFIDSLVHRIDNPAGQIDDAFERYSIAVLRGAAWQTGQLVWGMRDHPHLQSMFLRTLASGVGMAGHGLLI
ncbi:MAG: hypothetical protein QOE63_746 [Acidimicrobiaceae bacterium]